MDIRIKGQGGSGTVASVGAKESDFGVVALPAIGGQFRQVGSDSDDGFGFHGEISLPSPEGCDNEFEMFGVFSTKLCRILGQAFDAHGEDLDPTGRIVSSCVGLSTSLGPFVEVHGIVRPFYVAEFGIGLGCFLHEFRQWDRIPVRLSLYEKPARRFPDFRVAGLDVVDNLVGYDVRGSVGSRYMMDIRSWKRS